MKLRTYFTPRIIRNKLFSLVVVLSFPSSLFAQTCPGFPERGVQIIDALFNNTLANGNDDQRRVLTRTFIEQLVFEFPNDGWTWKSADPTRPPSKDSIAKVVGNKLCNWDWQNGSTRQRSVQVGDIGADITGQNPIKVTGINHLNDTPTNPGNPTNPAEYAELIAKLNYLIEHQELIFTNSKDIWQMNVDAINGRFDILEEKIDNPGWFKRVMSSRYTQLGLAVLTTYITQRQMKN